MSYNNIFQQYVLQCKISQDRYGNTKATHRLFQRHLDKSIQNQRKQITLD